MTCPKCGNTISSGAKFCSLCGEPLFRPCFKCGKPIFLEEQFCSNCGSDNSTEAIEVIKAKRKKTKRKRKIFLLIILSLIVIFGVIQGISIIKQLKGMEKLTPPMPVIYSGSSYSINDEADYYAPAWLFVRVEKGYYLFYLVNMITGEVVWDFNDEFSQAMTTGSSKLIYYGYNTNSFFVPYSEIELSSKSIYTYSEKIKWINFGWFWNPENTEIILSSGVKVYPYKYYGRIPFSFDGTIIINGVEVIE